MKFEMNKMIQEECELLDCKNNNNGNCACVNMLHNPEDGFQCDEFDYYFEDLDSIAETLFNEKIIGKPVEIRTE